MRDGVRLFRLFRGVFNEEVSPTNFVRNRNEKREGGGGLGPEKSKQSHGEFVVKLSIPFPSRFVINHRRWLVLAGTKFATTLIPPIVRHLRISLINFHEYDGY